MHRLLKQQLQKIGLDKPGSVPDVERWEEFLQWVEQSYHDAEKERIALEHTLSNSSIELQEFYNSLMESAEIRLAESQDYLKTIINSLAEGLAWFDVEGRIRLLNPSGCFMLGVMEQDVSNHTLFDICNCSAYDKEGFEKVVQEGASWQKDDAQFNRLDFNRRDFSVAYKINPMYSGSKIIGAVMTFRDISLQKDQDAHIRLWATVFQNTEEGVIITDPENNIIAVNAAFTEITGYLETEVKGSTPDILKSDRHDADFFRVMWDRLTTLGFWQGEIYSRRKNGEIYPQWTVINSVKDEQGKVIYFIFVFSDISRIKQSEEQMEYLAHHDSLTGLPNRYKFEKLLEQSMRELNVAPEDADTVALMFMDVDRFKNINDTLGHLKGDQLLRQIARRLSSILEADDVIARQGGDDFVILLAGIKSRTEIEERARRVLGAFKRPFLIEDQDVFICTSLGVSVAPDDGRDPMTLIKHADTAMFHAKESGGNSYAFYTKSLSHRTKERFELETQLRYALDRGEFMLYYQPQFNIPDQRLVGVEALVRWNNPGRGMVPPDQFIFLAEETHLIDEIGAWVLTEACDQARVWQEAGYDPIRMAVNLSSHQFRSGKIVDQVERALEQSGLAPEYLELELTESVLMTDPESAMSILKQLRKLGVHLAIDDFGTGYSSLNYLKLFEVDALKIDCSFIQGIPQDKNDELISRAVIALGRSFGLRVVAEGVETRAQIDFLLREGCDEMQGYYYSRPVPAVDIVGFLGTGVSSVVVK